MSQIQMAHGFRYVTRFIDVERPRLSLTHRTEAAVARADITCEHECCGTVRPTFKDIGATCFLADGVKIQTFDQLQNVILIGRIAQANTEPVRFWLTNLA